MKIEVYNQQIELPDDAIRITKSAFVSNGNEYTLVGFYTKFNGKKYLPTNIKVVKK